MHKHQRPHLRHRRRTTRHAAMPPASASASGSRRHSAGSRLSPSAEDEVRGRDRVGWAFTLRRRLHLVRLQAHGVPHSRPAPAIGRWVSSRPIYRVISTSPRHDHPRPQHANRLCALTASTSATALILFTSAHNTSPLANCSHTSSLHTHHTSSKPTTSSQPAMIVHATGDFRAILAEGPGCTIHLCCTGE